MAYRPTDPDVLAREAQALAALGLSVQDIAEALKLTPGSVTALLAWPEKPKLSLGADGGAGNSDRDNPPGGDPSRVPSQ